MPSKTARGLCHFSSCYINLVLKTVTSPRVTLNIEVTSKMRWANISYMQTSDWRLPESRVNWGKESSSNLFHCFLLSARERWKTEPGSFPLLLRLSELNTACLLCCASVSAGQTEANGLFRSWLYVEFTGRTWSRQWELLMHSWISLVTCKQCWASYSKNVIYYSLLVTTFKINIVTLLITFWQQ